MSAPGRDEILRPRKLKWAFMLLLCAGFSVGGYWMIRSHEGFWGYVNFVFFGLGAVVSLIQFLPGSSFLRLGAEGFTIRAMWRTTFYRWSDIERFGVGRNPASNDRMVAFDFSPTYPDREKGRVVKKINRATCGFEGALPDNYGWDHAELVAHLNRLREQYLRSPQPT